MNDYTFESLARREDDNHWFFAQRKFILKDLIQSFVFPQNTAGRILDIGCGTGGTTRELSGYGEVTGLEPNPKAVSLIRERFGGLNVVQGGTDRLNSLFSGESFDLITIFNVLYHSQASDSQTVLKDVFNLAKSEGWLLWTEPAHPMLSRKMDSLVHAKKRFMPSEMRNLAESSGFKIKFKTHLLFWASPIAFMMSLADKINLTGLSEKKLHQDESLDQKRLPETLNNALSLISKLEWKISRKLPIPYGTSYLVLAQKE